MVEAVQAAMAAAGLDQCRYGGHSCHIEAATEAAKKGIGDLVIKTLGRRKSLAYLDYVKIPRSELVQYSAVNYNVVCIPVVVTVLKSIGVPFIWFVPIVVLCLYSIPNLYISIGMAERSPSSHQH